MHKDLRSCIELLKSADRLITIKKQADPRLEVPALMKAAEKAGKAVLFEKVSKPGFRIINNIVSSREVLALFFETSPQKVVNEWIDRLKTPIPPELVFSGPVKDIVRKGSDVNLNDLPIVTHCTKDAGPFITAGLLVAKNPDTGIRNVSINRMQLKGRDKPAFALRATRAVTGTAARPTSAPFSRLRREMLSLLISQNSMQCGYLKGARLRVNAA